MFVLLLTLRSSHDQYMAVRSTQGRNRVAHSTQGDVTIMEMDCGACIICIRFRIPDQYIVTQGRKTTTFCLKHSFYKKKPSSPFTQTWVCLALSFYVNVSVYVNVAKAQKMG